MIRRFSSASFLGLLLGLLLAVAAAGSAMAATPSVEVLMGTPQPSDSSLDYVDQDISFSETQFNGGVGQNQNLTGGGDIIQIVQQTSGFGPGNAGSNYSYTPSGKH